MIYLTNSFSINMLTSNYARIAFIKVSKEEAAKVLEKNEFTSAIGHKDLAQIVKSELGLDTDPYNRISIQFTEGDALVITQYRGPRLPEGTTELPEGAKIEYYYVVFAAD